ncbi:hypothetical protein Lepto7376_0472 [[Leptolyngbya] sp. PCC 7376]|nr:hypothetical protein Lepto7376_0472 [[Leptolyngbya] sp. PCC 7376]
MPLDFEIHHAQSMVSFTFEIFANGNSDKKRDLPKRQISPDILHKAKTLFQLFVA